MPLWDRWDCIKLIKKTFSTLNFSLLISGLTILISCVYFSADSIRKVPSTSIFAIVALLCFLGTLYIKFPVFIEKVKYQNEPYGDIDIKKVNWGTCLYYSIFTAEPSNFASIFSKKYLVFHRNNRNCSFEWKYEKPKVIHKILDIILMVMLICVAIIISKILKNWSDIENIGYYILIFIFAVLLAFKRIILSYGLSVKEEKYGYNVHVIYPYSTSRFSLMKQFGQAMPFTKTIMITQDVFNGNPIIKEYIIAHEIGHIHDNIRTFLIILSSVLSLAFVSLSHFG